MKETYEAVYRLASALYAEYEATDVEGYITYQELARILNRFGYDKQTGGEYTETHEEVSKLRFGVAGSDQREGPDR